MKHIAIITGASSGIGREFAIQISKKYSKLDELWLIGRNKDELIQTSDSIKIPVNNIVMDLSKNESYYILNDLLKESEVSVRILVNCAGSGRTGDFMDNSIDDICRVTDINAKGLAAVTRVVLPYITPYSHIIQVCSMSAMLPQPDFSIYAASKAYVRSFSKALYYELKSSHISVTCVCPGPVKTKFFEVADPEQTRPAYKKIFMYKAQNVVSKALKDAAVGDFYSIYGFMMNLLYGLEVIIPESIILSIMYGRFGKKNNIKDADGGMNEEN